MRRGLKKPATHFYFVEIFLLTQKDLQELFPRKLAHSLQKPFTFGIRIELAE